MRVPFIFLAITCKVKVQLSFCAKVKAVPQYPVPFVIWVTPGICTIVRVRVTLVLLVTIYFTVGVWILNITNVVGVIGSIVNFGWVFVVAMQAFVKHKIIKILIIIFICLKLIVILFIPLQNLRLSLILFVFDNAIYFINNLWNIADTNYSFYY